MMVLSPLRGAARLSKRALICAACQGGGLFRAQPQGWQQPQAGAKERRLREEQEEREKLDPIYKENIAKAEQEKLIQLEEVAKFKEKRIDIGNSLKIVDLNGTIDLKPFKIEFITLTHSILDHLNKICNFCI